MQRSAPNRWGSPQRSMAHLPQGGFQRFPQAPSGSDAKYPSQPFQQQGPRGEVKKSFDKERPLIRPSQFSGPTSGPRPSGQPNFRSPFGNANPFESGQRFRTPSPNRPTAPPGMMGGPRPDQNRSPALMRGPRPDQNGSPGIMRGPRQDQNGPPGMMRGPRPNGNVSFGMMRGPRPDHNRPPDMMRGPRPNHNGPPDMMRGPRPNQNGPPGMMRGPRPNFNFQNGPRFHQKPFHKKQQKSGNKPPGTGKQQEKGEVKYFCDTCDRGYKDEDKYREHVDGHEKCRFEGCTYIAAPKLVQLHINVQHRTGLAKKIWSMDSPEDVKKWREERKKHYPTPENVAKKKSDQASREERGEVIQDKYFGKMHGRGQNRGRGRGRGMGDRRRRGDSSDMGGTGPKQRKMEDSNNNQESRTDSGNSSQEKQVKASGNDPLSSILDGHVSDDETEDTPPSELSAAGGLGALMASYGAESEEDEKESAEKTASNTVENRLGAGQAESSSQDSRAGNHQEAKRTNEKEEHAKDGSQKEHGRHRRRKRGKKNQQKNKWEPPPNGSRLDKSLLEKLLAKDIRRERNKILQCVHYIVKKNFFGIGQKSKEAAPSGDS